MQNYSIKLNGIIIFDMKLNKENVLAFYKFLRVYLTKPQDRFILYHCFIGWGYQAWAENIIAMFHIYNHFEITAYILNMSLLRKLNRSIIKKMIVHN